MKLQTAVIVKTIEKMQCQVSAARVVGKFAVEFGTRELGKAVRGVIGTITEKKISPVGSDEMSDSTDSNLAIANYDNLTATEIIAQLGLLSADELGAIAAFENTHRMRRTIAFKIDQLLRT